MASERIGSISKILRHDKDKREVRRLTVSDGVDAKGKRIRHNKTFHGSFAEAKRELAKMLATERPRAATAGGDMTVAEWAEVWGEEHIDRNLAPKTRQNYRRMLDTRILRGLGHIPLASLTPDHIEQFYRALDKEGIRLDRRGGEKYADSTARLSAATQAKCRRILGTMLQAAVYRRLIPHNPAKEARAPKHAATRTVEYYNEADVTALTTALQPEPIRFRALVWTALTTGMRRGELLALEWDDINLDSGLISIRHSAFAVYGEGGDKGQRVKEPKTRTSNRKVMVPPVTIETLREWQRQQAEERAAAGDGWQAGRYIFTTPAGRWLSIDRITRDWRCFVQSIRVAAGEITLQVTNTTGTEQTITGPGLRLTLAGKAKGTARVTLPAGIHHLALHHESRQPSDARRRRIVASDRAEGAAAVILQATITTAGLQVTGGETLRPLTFHGLRHTSASMMIADGLDVLSVAGVLGHAQTSTTVDVYGHMLHDAAERNALNMQKRLGGKSSVPDCPLKGQD